MDDDGLIARVAAGDEGGLRELFSRHAPWLAARLRVVLPAVDVEDVLQETFLGVWRGAVGYRPGGTAGGWLWGIARRQATLFLRRRGPGELVLPAVVEADMRGVGDPTETVLIATGPGESGSRIRPSGRGRPGNVATVVCRGPVSGRSGCVNGRAGGHCEKPGTSGSKNVAGGAR